MNNSQAYVYGNTAHKYTHQTQQQKTQPKKHLRQKPKKREKSIGINTIYTLILSLVIIVTCIILVVLLKAQFSVANSAQNIISLQQELLEIKKSNSKINNNIQKSVDMNEIYRLATEELGMIQPQPENIRYIEPKSEAYTIQYTQMNKKESKKGINLGNVLGFISKGW